MSKDFPLDIEILIGRVNKQMLVKKAPLEEACAAFEKRLVRLILGKVGGNESRAAKLLEIENNILSEITK